MRTIYHDGRLFAIAAFVFCITTTLAILLGDVLNGTTAFALKHWMAITVLMCAVLFGHIAKKVSFWDLKKYGFWLLFWASTALVAYSSIGRQSETMTISATQAEQDMELRRAAKAEIASNKAMLSDAGAKLGKECASGAGKRCAGIERTIAVYTAAIAGNQAILDKLGPAKPVAANADKTAEVLALFGYDPKRVKAMAVLFEPIAYFAVLEYGSILTLSLALGGGKRNSRKGVCSPAADVNSNQSSASVGSLHANNTPSKTHIEIRDIADRSMLTAVPVTVKDNMQTSYPLATAEVVALFRSPNRWTYQRDLS